MVLPAPIVLLFAARVNELTLLLLVKDLVLVFDQILNFIEGLWEIRVSFLKKRVGNVEVLGHLDQA
jgi:hypothetical protein